MITLTSTGDSITVTQFGNFDSIVSYRDLTSTTYAASRELSSNPNLFVANIYGGFNGAVRSFEVQTDNKIVVVGDFLTYRALSQNQMIRIYPSGIKDENFNIGSGFDGSQIRKVKVLADGKILVGGLFSFYTGSTNNKLIKLNSDGTKDSTFNIGTGFNQVINSIEVQNDNKMLIGGDFTTYTGSTNNRLIRLNSNGTKDSSFNIGTGFGGATTPVYSIAIQSGDSKILVGGSYTTFTGSTNNGLVRLNTNGTKDSTFNIGTGFGSIVDVRTIAIQSDGKILVGGAFTTFTGSTNNRLIRLNSNGTKDSSFNIGTGFNSVIYSVVVQPNGKILVGGNFTTFTGSTNNNLIRLNSDGTKDSTFNIGTGFGGSNDVKAIKVLSDNSIIVGGSFTSFTGSSFHNEMVRLNSNGTIYNPTATILSAPSSNTARVVDYISLTNIFSGITTSVYLKSGGVNYKLWNGNLAVNEKLEYTSKDGFNVLDLSGAVKGELNNSIGETSNSLSTKILSSDVINADAVANTLYPVSGLSFNVVNGNTYWFRCYIPYSSAATGTGSRWTLSGATINTLRYHTRFVSSSAGAISVNYNSAYGLPAAASTQSLTDNFCVIEGIYKPSANGTLYPMFASEVSASAITAKAGAYLQYKQII